MYQTRGARYGFKQPITSITSVKVADWLGECTIQFHTGASCTNSETTTYFMGDDCTDGVFTPQANTKYEIVAWGYTPNDASVYDLPTEYKAIVVSYGSAT